MTRMNALIWHAFCCDARVVRPLLCFIAMICSSCLIPQPATIFDLPPERNAPPRIVGFSPSLVSTLCSESGGTEVSFVLHAEDPDTDELYSRWFVDVPRSKGNNYDVQSTNLDSRKPSSPNSSVSWELDAATWRLTELANPGDHVLEVFVADAPFDRGITVKSRQRLPLPGGGSVADTPFVDSFAWFVTTRAAPCRN